MSDPVRTSHKKQDFEQALDASDKSVAQFNTAKHTPFARIQHFLHGNPTMVPVIVLLTSITIFGLIAGPKAWLFSPPGLTCRSGRSWC